MGLGGGVGGGILRPEISGESSPPQPFPDDWVPEGTRHPKRRRGGAEASRGGRHPDPGFRGPERRPGGSPGPFRRRDPLGPEPEALLRIAPWVEIYYFGGPIQRREGLLLRVDSILWSWVRAPYRVGFPFAGLLQIFTVTFNSH